MPLRAVMNSGKKMVRNNQHSNNFPTGHPTTNNEAASGNGGGAVEQPAFASVPLGQLTVVHDAASQALRETTRDETKITVQNASRNTTRVQVESTIGMK
ncbi:hypothetical protein V498_02547 [Pseudogymnoascus sp. VKM F-4517 (FW-2822)]|nr:hypothetical protein V498_02547 [Pseudogymnoascus sp. VKM F-4517 (FW-2822)]